MVLSEDEISEAVKKCRVAKHLEGVAIRDSIPLFGWRMQKKIVTLKKSQLEPGSEAATIGFHRTTTYLLVNTSIPKVVPRKYRCKALLEVL
jgi:hypothetical protein